MVNSITKEFKKFLMVVPEELKQAIKEQYNVQITKSKSTNIDYSINVPVDEILLKNERNLKQHMKLLAKPCIDLLVLDSEVSSINVIFATKFDGWKDNTLEISFQRDGLDWQRFFVEFVKEKLFIL